MAQPRRSTHPFIIDLVPTQNGFIVDKFGLVENPSYNKSIISHNQPPKVTSEADILALVEKPFLGSSSEEELPEQHPQPQPAPPPNQPANLNGNQLKEAPPANPYKPPFQHLPHLSWFSLDSIHDYEIENAPEFFTGKGYKTPELYTKFRNFIVRLFMTEPTRYLTKIACRRALKGDANAIIRIHKFLESEGIINFGLSPTGSLDFERPVLQKTPSPASRARELPNPNTNPDPIDPEGPNSNSLVYNVTTRVLSKTYRSFCVKCGVTCGMVWFQSKHGTSESCVCEKCYSKITELERQEYEKMDICKRIQAEGAARNKLNWSVDENYKMIEAVTEKDATWESMYQKMGQKRTKEDIVFHFLQFPMTNFDPRKKPPEAKLAVTLQSYIKLIKDFYEKSPYFIYDYSGEGGFEKESVSDDLKSLILLELQKYSHKLEALQEMQAIQVANELKTNLANILTSMRMKKQTRPAPKKEEKIEELQPALDPLIEAPVLQQPIQEQEQDPLDYLNLNDINDVDKFLN